MLLKVNKHLNPIGQLITFHSCFSLTKRHVEAVNKWVKFHTSVLVILLQALGPIKVMGH